MDSVPASAVCNEAVKLAVKKNFGTLRGFVNGVLRNIARNIDNIEYPDKSTNTDKYLSVKYSVPEELAGYFLKKFGDNETEEMFEAFNKDKSTYIRCNTKKTDIAGLTAALEAEGVTVTNEGIDKRIDYALKISGYDYLGGLKSFRDGLFFVQDISSMLASQGGFIKRDAYVIDVCAAPGGKSINAALMADIGHVSSRDISGRKVSLIKENAERLGIDNITYKVWDAVKKDEESVEKADVLICDLPCSGLGIIGRKPDIKYNVTYEKIKELALLQRKILSTVWEYVKKDGILIYSTCTVTPEENAENTEWLVNNYPFELIGKPEQIMPQDGTGDGFYIARLKRNGMTMENIDNRIDIKSMTIEELEELLVSMGDKKFRGKQIFSWLHEKLVVSFDDMTNLSKPLREKLEEKCRITALKAETVQVSKIDGTSKFLFELYDGNLIESVLMKYHHGNSVCISSQVGCRMGCRFCASTLDGCVRNLTPSEMLDQIYTIQKISGERVDNVVVMGSGEPMDNFDNIIRFLSLLNSEQGLNISARNITVSTCGIVPKIIELADKKLQITLAISLHAPNDELRKTMMPIANKYSIEEIMEACRYYLKQTNRRISFEYSLVKDVNDTEECAQQLISLVKGMNCHINLIPVNPIKERDYRQSEQKAIYAFKNKLEKNGINVTIRREMGRDIDGACGQLRKSYIGK